jgi:hypothetical protein
MTSLNFNLASSSKSFYFEAELTGNQVIFDFPSITWAPLNADKQITFELNDAPVFVTLA